jgi:4-amino-4-deoxy-L-arabinose transferase-like glycosyltransferase
MSVHGAATGSQPPSSSLSVPTYLLLLLLSLALYLPGIAALPPTDRDEARFAEATHQMVQSGDWIDIRFRDEPRYNKPIGIYWLQAASARLLGPADGMAIWAYRIPSLVAACLAVLMTAWLGSRLFGPAAGEAAAVILAATVMLGAEARLAKTDAVLLACVVAAQAALAHTYLGGEDRAPPGRLAPLAFWLALAVGVLVKGPIVILVSGGTVALLGILDRRLAWLARLRPVVGVPVALAIVLPWLIAITVVSHGQFYRSAVGHELVGKLVGGQESHGAPPGTYLATAWFTFFPFSLLAALAAPWAWRHWREPAVRFCLAWIIPTWIVFELVPTKLMHYMLPTFPAIALLAAAATLEKGRRGRGYWIAAGVWFLLPVAFAAALPGLSWGLLHRIDLAGIAAGLVLLAATAAGLFWLGQGRGKQAIGALAAGALVFYAVAYQRVLPDLSPLWISPRTAEAVRAASACPAPTVATAGYREPSLVFLLGGSILFATGEEAGAHLLDHPCAVAIVDKSEEKAFFDRLAQAGVTPIARQRIVGINYSLGKPVDLGIYTIPAEPARASGG